MGHRVKTKNMNVEQKRPTPESKIIATIVVAAIFIVPVFYVFSCDDSTKQMSHEADEPKATNSSTVNHSKNMLAYHLSAEYVSNHLKLPNTAAFPGLFEKKDHVYPTGDTLFVVTSWVDSQNDLGAVVRNKWRCVVKIKNDKAEYLGLDIDGVRIL